ncbi:inorganic phosphate transporter [Zhihengliuella sp.]|uniref:inorganic phosphate transporter n=1 Tax=Zhihengliuella sp. TaxID=1954483 RepID=UPI00281158EF|nr:inorganic phosphate transporter [Zhihengliuella sp.]
METFLLVAVTLATCAFALLNGFRDAANSVATSVRTRALGPRVAVVTAAVFTFGGTMMSTRFSEALVDAADFHYTSTVDGLAVLLVAVLTGGAWLLWCYARGIPTSSGHALFAALAGALLGHAFLNPGEPRSVPLILLFGLAVPILVTPLVAFALSYAITIPAMWIMRHTSSNDAARTGRAAQAIASCAVALGNGLQDGQRNAAFLTLAFVMVGSTTADADVPLWIQLLCAACMGLGALGGGWRIAHTISNRLVRFDPVRGASAQLVAASLLYVGAQVLHLPLSTTQAVTSAIVGSGASQRFETVLWANMGRVMRFWALGPVVCCGVGIVLMLAVHPLVA